MSISEDFPKRITRLRNLLGDSQTDFAQRLGISRNYVSMLEQGREPSASLRKLIERLEAESLARESYEDSPRARLKAAREHAGLSIRELAKRMGYEVGVLQAVEEGGARISRRMAQKLCEVLPELELESLLDGSESPRVMDQSGVTGTVGDTPPILFPPGVKARYVPLLSWAQAGTLDNGALDEGYSYEGVLAVDCTDRRAFGVTIRGDSMSPRISEGDKAVVYPGRPPRNGDTVIARTVRGDVMCKLFQSKNGGEIIILSSYNPAYPPIEITHEEIAWIYPVAQVVQNLLRD
ncbi:MAG: S24 family peptidase [Chthoniobacteraceae bacterium]